MSAIDFVVLLATVVGIASYGMWKTRVGASGEQHLRGSRALGWGTIGLSVMATQASAVTFLSVPGQGYEDGLRFVQFYFGMPIAMVVICVFFLPRYRAANVYTAYEYLERRFDVRVRTLGALLFLVQRGLAAGITIYAPAIVLSSIAGWSLEWTVVLTGALVIAYTVSGGTDAVSHTQKQQMVVILLGMAVAAGVLFARLPEGIGLDEATWLAGTTGRMRAVDPEFDLANRYNVWSGLIGGFFLALSYFGTDQSQVQRYLSGRSLTESRLGLIFNAVIKIPMQLGILGIGILLFAFYTFTPAPLHFNPAVEAAMERSTSASEWSDAHRDWLEANEQRRAAAAALLAAREAGADDTAAREAWLQSNDVLDGVRAEATEVARAALPAAELRDTDHVFIRFVIEHLPRGLVGLLVAVILMAAMSSTASELNALGTTTTVDLWRRLGRRDLDDRALLRAARIFTVGWGLIALAFAMTASMLDNLIEAVNILGSIFYGPILGIFLCAFLLPRVRAAHVLPAAVVGQAVVLVMFFTSELGFLWYNFVGCAGVVVTALALSFVVRGGAGSGSADALA